MKKILTCQQLVKEISGVSIPENIKDLSELITLARICKIGTPISFQKTEYDERDLELMKKLIDWWCWMDRNGNSEFRNKNTNKSIHKNIINIIQNNSELVLYAVFCPSYKTGIGAVGYTGKVGERTKMMIDVFRKFVYQSQNFGFKVRGEVMFSDLLLENYEQLLETDYRENLKSNFKEFKEIFNNKDYDKLIRVRLLSDIESIKKTIGETGITEGNLGISKQTFDLVFKRNLVFYQEKLGWNEKEVLKRTEVLARCYSFMGSEFRKIWPQGIMFWTESAYERASMYSGTNELNPLAVIFPKKI